MQTFVIICACICQQPSTVNSNANCLVIDHFAKSSSWSRLNSLYSISDVTRILAICKTILIAYLIDYTYKTHP